MWRLDGKTRALRRGSEREREREREREKERSFFVKPAHPSSLSPVPLSRRSE